MAADAIALFRPKHVERLLPFLDLDDESEASDGLYAEALADGVYLVHTFQPYEAFVNDPAAIVEWVEQFGDAWSDVHDDPRGLFMFPDDHEPESSTYDGLIAELAQVGAFLPVTAAGDAMPDFAALAHSLEASGIDMGALQSLAGQIMNGMKSGESFTLGKLMTDVNEQLFGTIAKAAATTPSTLDASSEAPAAEEGAPGAPAKSPTPPKRT